MAFKFSYACAIAALALIAVGCRTPMQKRLAKDPNWQKMSQYMAIHAPNGGSGLIWHPFPDPNNPDHQRIWNALWKNHVVGDGFGCICNYYRLYLVTVSDVPGKPVSSFYDPKTQIVFDANYGTALAHYHGNRRATASNAVALVEHLLAVNTFPAFVISNATDIPHATFSKENPGRSFNEWLLSKGIVITPPTLVKVNKSLEGRPGGDSEYNIFVYMPCGGRLFRYEVQCGLDWIGEVNPYCIADSIGDCWYIVDYYP